MVLREAEYTREINFDFFKIVNKFFLGGGEFTCTLIKQKKFLLDLKDLTKESGYMEVFVMLSPHFLTSSKKMNEKSWQLKMLLINSSRKRENIAN